MYEAWVQETTFDLSFDPSSNQNIWIGVVISPQGEITAI